jgi:hypothetical protein
MESLLSTPGLSHLNSAPFSDMLYSPYTNTVHDYQLAVNSAWETCLTHKNQIVLQTSLQDQFSNVVAFAHEL